MSLDLRCLLRDRSVGMRRRGWYFSACLARNIADKDPEVDVSYAEHDALNAMSDIPPVRDVRGLIVHANGSRILQT